MDVINKLASKASTEVTRRVNLYAGSSLQSVKDHFGKAFYFSANNDMSIIRSVTDGFLRVHDKKFNKHTTIYQRKPYYIDKEVLIPVEKDPKTNIPNTFIYVATGNRVPNKETTTTLLRDSEYDKLRQNDMYIYIFGKKSPSYVYDLEKFIDKTINKDELGIYNCTTDNYNDNMRINYIKMDPRELRTLYFSNGEIDKVIKFLDRFKDNEEFYKDKHIKYKTGILLHGKPGTGKTSLANAIANHYNRSIINVDISVFDKLDLGYLTQSINADKQRYVVLLEDIDTLFLNRTAEDSLNKEENSIVNRLLQFLDSNTSPNDVIFIATTNHIDRLDDALLRHGRFDLKVEVDEIIEKDVYRFGRDFTLDDASIAEIIEKYKDDVKDDGLFNQSAMQAYMLNKLENKERDTKVIDTAELIAEKIAAVNAKGENGDDDERY